MLRLRRRGSGGYIELKSIEKLHLRNSFPMVDHTITIPIQQASPVAGPSLARLCDHPCNAYAVTDNNQGTCITVPACLLV